ncbi:MAG: hypothetical protein LUE14_04315 [Clostridiales bacterium]|nr:hypothetical protein [Clostridiales bacterium]
MYQLNFDGHAEKPIEGQDFVLKERHLTKKSAVTASLEAALAAAIIFFSIQGFRTEMLLVAYPLFLASMVVLAACLFVMPPRMAENDIPLEAAFYRECFVAQCTKSTCRGGKKIRLYICFYGQIKEMQAGERGLMVVSEFCVLTFRIPPGLAMTLKNNEKPDMESMAAAERMCRRVKVKIAPCSIFRMEKKEAEAFKAKISIFSRRFFNYGQENVCRTGAGAGCCHGTDTVSGGGRL